jgi:glycerate kinase
LSAVRPLRVLLAPDTFKGSLSSVDVTRALADGWRRVRPDDELVPAPLADGGEGTLEAVAEAGGWEWQECQARDPLGRPLTARWLRSKDGTEAAMELAEASGLSRLPEGEPRSPLAATTDGTGDILRAIVDSGVRRVVMGVGGSATTDGGSGMLRALGARYTTDAEAALPGPVPNLAGIDLSGLDRNLGSLELRVACDVTNPLLGELGAAAVYAPQKGAWPEDVAVLDAWLARYADLLEAAAGSSARNLPGAGAAGGASFGLLCLASRLRSFELMPGVDLVMQAIGFDRRLSEADMVITGEGRVDSQTAFGKTALGVARRAAAAGVPCIAIGGGLTNEGAAVLAAEGAAVTPVVPGPMDLGEAMDEAGALVEATGERLARIVDVVGAVALGRATLGGKAGASPSAAGRTR